MAKSPPAAPKRTTFEAGDVVNVPSGKRGQPKLLGIISEMLTSHAEVVIIDGQGEQSNDRKKVLQKSMTFAEPPAASLRTPATAEVLAESTAVSSSSGGGVADMDEPAPLAESIDVDADTTAAPAPQAVATSALATAAAWADAADVFGPASLLMAE